jgi:hypothetical protein
LDLRYDEGEEEEQMELNNVVVMGGGGGGGNGMNSQGGGGGQKELFRTEPDWTMQQDVGELVYLGQRKRVEASLHTHQININIIN